LGGLSPGMPSTPVCFSSVFTRASD
jgi:hypothetical protein